MNILLCVLFLSFRVFYFFIKRLHDNYLIDNYVTLKEFVNCKQRTGRINYR